jgi:hypothetical protein
MGEFERYGVVRDRHAFLPHALQERLAGFFLRLRDRRRCERGGSGNSSYESCY